MTSTRPAAPGAQTSPGGEAPSIGTLLRRLGNETGELVRAEISLAKLEFRELARQAALDSARVGAALAVTLVGASCLAAGGVLGLGQALGGRYGLAALLVGLTLLLAGGLLARSAVRGLARTGRGPAEKLESLRQDGTRAAHELRALKQELQKGTAPERPVLAGSRTTE